MREIFTKRRGKWDYFHTNIVHVEKISSSGLGVIPFSTLSFGSIIIIIRRSLILLCYFVYYFATSYMEEENSGRSISKHICRSNIQIHDDRSAYRRCRRKFSKITRFFVDIQFFNEICCFFSSRWHKWGLYDGILLHCNMWSFGCTD